MRQATGRLPVSPRPGLVVARARPYRWRSPRLADYLPFVITLLAGGIVVAIVALALGGPSGRPSLAVPLPPPSVSATPAPSVGAAAGHQGLGH